MIKFKNPEDEYNFQAGPRTRIHMEEGSGRTIGFHLLEERCPLCDEEDALPKGPPVTVTAVDEKTGTITIDTRTKPEFLPLSKKAFEWIRDWRKGKRTTLSRRVQRNRDR